MEGRCMEEKKVLPDNCQEALRKLEILGYISRLRTKVDETSYFMLYLSRAIQNIQDITGIKNCQPDKTGEELRNKGKEVIAKLAHFLWLFKIDEPQRDFDIPEKHERLFNYEEITIMLVRKLIEIRNLFAHPMTGDSSALRADRDFYVFMEGLLLPMAQDAALKKGEQTEKLFKLKLMNSRDRQRKEYEFTRKGLIFLVCLALYKDDAVEFCHLFDDLKLPVRCPRGISPEDCDKLNCTTSGDPKKVCNISRAKALISMFTCFSERRGRTALETENQDYLCFADCLGYLNKTPSAAMNYLALKEERDKLAELKKESTESDDNKEFKYSLHRRFRNRFLSFAAGYCEDFDILPSIQFKRLDISADIGRKRYAFGKGNDNKVRLDRHYAIEKDAIRFAFIPEQHYGPIHISSLRSCFSATEMRRFLYVEKFLRPGKINEEITKYFTAYHRILENMLNSDLSEEIWLEDSTYLDDFSTVSGKTKEEINEDLSVLEPFFPSSLIRFFLHDAELPTLTDLKKQLIGRLALEQDHDVGFLRRMRKWNHWRQTPHDPEHKTPPPTCSPDEVLYGTRKCRFSDGELIGKVFDYLNLFLEPDRKFRQLPRGKQHNKGIQDYEYQLLHAAIGKFSLDQKSLWHFLEKRSELANPMKKLKEKLSCPKKNGQLPRRMTLAMLAKAAVTLHQEYCKSLADEWNQLKVDGNELTADRLRKDCRRFKIRTGMPLDRESLLKTILKIDLKSWQNAFDYENHKPFQNRQLKDTEHIAAQIPFPNGFAERLVPVTHKELKAFFKDGKFDFNQAFRSFPLDNKLSLRKFYDCAPLIDYMKSHDRKNSHVDAKAPGIATDAPDWQDFSGTALDKVIREIKETENQDKLLLNIAVRYYERYTKSTGYVKESSFKFTETTSVYDYFNQSTQGDFYGVKVEILPNDWLKPVLSIVRENAKIIGERMKLSGKNAPFAFYDMMAMLRQIQSEDRSCGLNIIPWLAKFDSLVKIPSQKYVEIGQNPSYNKEKQKEEIRKMEYSFYSRKIPKLTRQEYDSVADARNAVYHSHVGIATETECALKILEKYLNNVSYR